MSHRTIAQVLILTALAGLRAFAGTDTSQFVVNFAADTRDFHITIGGKVTSVKFTMGGQEIKPNNSNGGGTGEYNAAWNNAPGAGAVTVDLTGHEGGNNWNGKTWLTTDGGMVRPDVGNSGVFNSIFPEFAPDSAFLFGENGFSDTSLDIGGFQVSVISDINSLSSPNWFTATGPTFSFGGTVLGPGATQTALGSIPFNGSGWLKITATVDGMQQVMGYSSAPEPSAEVLIGGGLVFLGMRLRHLSQHSPKAAKAAVILDRHA